jgi:hypothetical protein
MSVGHATFVDALLDPTAPVPDGLVGPDGRAAGRRFDVYRNNVVAGLSNALETAFPVLRKLLGEQNFKGLAGIYVRKHPPATPLIMFFGAEMPGFLEGLPQLAHLPYLPDVARLELAMREAYHAADADPIAPETLRSLPPVDLLGLRVGLHPALRVFASPYPVHGIWARNMIAGAPKPRIAPETVMVTRPGYDPVQTVVPRGTDLLLAALSDGATLGDAIAAAQAAHPDFDPTTSFGALLSAGAITTIEATP